jgi:hypothetical protein
MKVRIQPYEQAVGTTPSSQIIWSKKWDVCVQCDNYEDAELLSNSLSKQWVGLTDEEMEEICDVLFKDPYLPQNFKLFAKAIEAKFKQKNTLK